MLCDRAGDIVTIYATAYTPDPEPTVLQPSAPSGFETLQQAREIMGTPDYIDRERILVYTTGEGELTAFTRYPYTLQEQ